MLCYHERPHCTFTIFYCVYSQLSSVKSSLLVDDFVGCTLLIVTLHDLGVDHPVLDVAGFEHCSVHFGLGNRPMAVFIDPAEGLEGLEDWFSGSICWRVMPFGFEHRVLSNCQWEFQDPKMQVLYHIFGRILGGYSLT